MRVEDLKKIGVIGAGIMGHGIAQTYALAGYQVYLHNISQQVLEKALSRIADNLDLFVETGLIEDKGVVEKL